MKKVKFTNLKTNEVKEMMVGEVGSHVYAIYKDVAKMNNTIRWCNQHKVNDVLNTSKFKIELFNAN